MFRRLWAPAMLTSVGWAISDMADSIVLGQKMHTVGLAAIGLILPVYRLSSMFVHGIGLGGSVRYARLMGEGKTKEAKDNFSAMFMLTLILGVATAALGLIFKTPLLRALGAGPEDGELFGATEAYLRVLLLSLPLFYISNVLNYYLRNDGSERLAGVGSVAGNITDVILNFVFVLGPLNLGTGGAALATAVGMVVTVAIYLPGLFSKNHSLRFALPAKGWFVSSFRSFRAGFSTSVQYLYLAVFFLVCNNILARISGEAGIAVFDVLQSVSYLVLYLYDCTARAMQPIFSTYNGEQNDPGRKSLLRIGFTSGMIVGGAVAALIVLFPGAVCAVFGVDGAEVESMAHIALRFYALSSLFAGASILLSNYFQSYERERLSFLIETLRGAVILLPVTVVCANFGKNGFWALFPITEAVSLILAVVIIRWLTRHGKYLIQRVPEERIFRRTILSTSTDIGSASSDLEAFCERWEATMRQQYTVMMSVEELGLTILQHGFHGREDGYIQITVIAREDGDFELHLRDNATKFNPFSLDTARANSSDDVDLDSIGVLVIKERSKEFKYRQYQGFNTLIVKI